MKRSYVFIAGPYKGKDFIEIDRNIARARDAAVFLANNGVPFFCPHLNSGHFEAMTISVPMDFWYDLDLRFLERASAIWLIDGWKNSQGSLAELARAQALQIEVFYQNEGAKLIYWWLSSA
mgnify:CR=1 FL=1